MLQEEIANNKANYELHLIREYALSRNNNIFKYIRNLTQSRNYPSILHLDDISAESNTDCANLFNRYFQSDTPVQSNIDNNLEPINNFSSISFIAEEVYQALLSLDPILKHQVLILTL